MYSEFSVRVCVRVFVMVRVSLIEAICDLWFYWCGSVFRDLDLI